MAHASLKRAKTLTQAGLGLHRAEGVLRTRPRCHISSSSTTVRQFGPPKFAALVMEPSTVPEQSLMIEENKPHRMLIDAERARFPCCIVWTPLPVLSWFVPFIGHIGICREDGVILDFAGPNFVCVDNFAFGAPTRYFQIKKEQCNCCLHRTDYGSKDTCYRNGLGRDLSTWDDSLHKSTQQFQHQSYNILTCNCHSFVANCLNRLCVRAGGWNVVNLAIFIFLNGCWVSKSAFVKTYLPFLVVLGLGITFGGWSFLSCFAVFIFLLVGWFVLGSYCFKKLIYV